MLKNFADEFKGFIMRGNVVDLAIGVVIGAAFGAIVKTIVDGLFTPLINMVIGGYDFSRFTVTPYGDATFQVGAVLQAVINFVIIGFCLFLVVKAMNRFKKKEEAKPAEPTETEKLLAEIRDLLKK